MGMALEVSTYISDPLATVRMLLSEWARYRRGWKPDNGYPKAVPWLDHVRGHVDGWTQDEDYDAALYAMRMRHVDQAVKNLLVDQQHAIGVVYLNEIGPLVWRSNRKPMNEIRAICERAEVALIPVFRRRDLI